jgi:hypothetical protein
LNRIVHNIQRAGTAHDPSHIFGSATPAHLASVFTVGRGFDTTKALKRALRDIVAEANRVIVNIFSPEVEFDSIWGRCFYSQANFDAHNAGYFTYMKVPSDVPWVEKKRVVDSEGEVSLPVVDMRDVSEDWVEAVASALGAEVEDEEDEGESTAEDTLASM